MPVREDTAVEPSAARHGQRSAANRSVKSLRSVDVERPIDQVRLGENEGALWLFAPLARRVVRLLIACRGNARRLSSRRVVPVGD